MNIAASPQLAAAVTNAGGLGVWGGVLLHTQDVSCQAEGQVPSKWWGHLGWTKISDVFWRSKEGLRFFWFKKMVCSFLSSIPSSNSNCVNKQIQPWLNSTFLGSFFFQKPTNKSWVSSTASVQTPKRPGTQGELDGSQCTFWCGSLAAWYEQWKNPGWLGYIGDYTTQLSRDYNKPW